MRGRKEWSYASGADFRVNRSAMSWVESSRGGSVTGPVWASVEDDSDDTVQRKDILEG